MMKLEYRAGYYGPRDFQHSTKEDREQQLQAELQSDLPDTDLPVYLAAGYFRTAENKYYVPVSLVVPASAHRRAARSRQGLARRHRRGARQEHAASQWAICATPSS